MGRTRGMADPNTLNQVLSESLGWRSYEEMLAATEANDKSKGPKGPKGGKKHKKDL
jgi:aspartyl-tRNA(Asn)/glutamyl-tRNA(Gln) amidotransferase subunit B